ncbi:MAG: hypothetical protein ACI8RZ_007504 [Myxococcota bacterium]|jgi:hypothetical protein
MNLSAETWHTLAGRPPPHRAPLGGDRGMSAALWRVSWPDGHTAVLKISRKRDRGAGELRFLRHAPPSPHLPRLIGAVEEADRVILLLEDLSDATPGDILVGVPASVAVETFAALGTIHALSVPDWSHMPPRWHPGTIDHVPAFTARHPHPFADRLLDLPAQVARHQSILAALPVGVLHSDCHLDNWMFREVPVLIDWETARVGPPIIDAVRLLMEGVSTSVRREAGGTLLAAWGRDTSGLAAAVWYSLNAMIPHHATIDLEALTPRMQAVHERCAVQALDLAADLGL